MSCSLSAGIISKCVPRGSTVDYKIGFRNGTILDATWFCHMQVTVKSTKELTTINRTVPNKNADQTLFLTTLTEAESNSLTEGATYIVGFELYNSVTGQVVEHIEELKIATSWVNRN